MFAQVVESFKIRVETLFLRIRDEDYAVGAFQDQTAAGFVENLAGNGVEVKARAKAAHGAQVERKKIEEKSAIGFGGERNHLSLLIRSGVLVDPLQVGGLPAKARTVVNKLAVNFASGKIYKRHNFLRISGLVLIASPPTCGQRAPANDASQLITRACGLGWARRSGPQTDEPAGARRWAGDRAPAVVRDPATTDPTAGGTRSVGEADVDAGGEDHVVRLCSRDRRIGDVAIGERRLPAEPFVDFGDGSGVEREPVLTGVAEVGIEIEDLGESGGFAELVHEVLAERDASQVAVHRDADAIAVVFTGVVRARKKI